MKKIRFALVGATGLVGKTAMQVLEEKKLPIDEYVFFASERSANTTADFMGEKYNIKELNESSFDEHFDVVIFCAGGDVSKKYAPIAASKGAIVIDNSSVFRMDKDVPLVVPEVNKEDISLNNGIIANPNCSTIQAVVALKPLDDKYKIKRIVYATYQAVSGAGKEGVEDLENTLQGKENKKFPYKIANNCIPHIDVFLDNGYTKEEMKMVDETRKILHNQDMKITATTVRVPVMNSHSEAINVEFENEFDVEEVKEILKNSPSVILIDDVENNKYPLAEHSNGRDEVFVGRIRRDESVENGLNMWVVADNLRKGAASNAIQIMEEILKDR